jgi:hypothetical protein
MMMRDELQEEQIKGKWKTRTRATLVLCPPVSHELIAGDGRGLSGIVSQEKKPALRTIGILTLSI